MDYELIDFLSLEYEIQRPSLPHEIVFLYYIYKNYFFIYDIDYKFFSIELRLLL